VALTTQRVVQSDCTLVGGDSGGPLFNMDGEVIGVHSRIGAANTWNFHVPVAVYTHSWEQLIASREWNGFAVPGTAVLGIDGDDHKLGCRISKVVPGYPASDAKLQVDDVIVKFDGKTFDRFETLRQFIVAKKPGDTVKLEVQRGKQTMTANVVLGMRRSAW
jgi:serine protease Do